MNARKRSDFYSGKKYKTDLSEYFTGCNILDEKIRLLQIDLDNGFSIYTKRNFLRFLSGHHDISNFGDQFVLLEEYYSKNNKYSNSEDLFKILYGKNEGSRKWNNKSASIAGKNNPWFDHGGKYSPYKEGSINYSPDAIKKAQANRSYNTRIQYWIDRGNSKEEAELKLKERQTTFSLKKCIEKHGEAKCLSVWKERQEKWQNTLKSKPQEEIDRINMSKSSGTGNIETSKSVFLYYIKFENKDSSFFKIGITTKSIMERFNLFILDKKYGISSELIFYIEIGELGEAFRIEQKILNKYANNRIRIDIPGMKTTEAFDINVLEQYYESK